MTRPRTTIDYNVLKLHTCIYELLRVRNSNNNETERFDLYVYPIVFLFFFFFQLYYNTIVSIFFHEYFNVNAEIQFVYFKRAVSDSDISCARYYNKGIQTHYSNKPSTYKI